MVKVKSDSCYVEVWGWCWCWWCVQLLSVLPWLLLLIWDPFPALTDSFLCCFFLELHLWEIKPQTPAHGIFPPIIPAVAHPSGKHLSFSITLGWIAAMDNKIRNCLVSSCQNTGDTRVWINLINLHHCNPSFSLLLPRYFHPFPSAGPETHLSQKLLCELCRARFSADSIK